MRATMGNSTAYDAAFYIYGGACLASTLAVWALPSPSPPHSDDDSSGSSKGCCAGAFSFTATKAEWRLVIAVSMLLLAYVGLEVAFGAFIHTYGTDALHYDSKKSQLLTSAFWGAITFSRVAAVLISMRASAVQMMWQNLAGTTLAAILLLFVGANATFSWVGAILFGLSMGSIFPTALNVAGKVMSIEGKVASCFVVGASLGELIIPWLNGVLIHYFGTRMFIVATFGGNALQLFIFCFVYTIQRSMDKRYDKLDVDADEGGTAKVLELQDVALDAT